MFWHMIEQNFCSDKILIKWLSKRQRGRWKRFQGRLQGRLPTMTPANPRTAGKRWEGGSHSLPTGGSLNRHHQKPNPTFPTLNLPTQRSFVAPLNRKPWLPATMSHHLWHNQIRRPHIQLLPSTSLPIAHPDYAFLPHTPTPSGTADAFAAAVLATRQPSAVTQRDVAAVGHMVT